MAKLRTPIVAIILGEGGSGGAIGIGVANKVLMMENAWYSVISPKVVLPSFGTTGKRSSRPLRF